MHKNSNAQHLLLPILGWFGLLSYATCWLGVLYLEELLKCANVNCMHRARVLVSIVLGLVACVRKQTLLAAFFLSGNLFSV